MESKLTYAQMQLFVSLSIRKVGSLYRLVNGEVVLKFRNNFFTHYAEASDLNTNNSLDNEILYYDAINTYK